jgi:hypothetical protein
VALIERVGGAERRLRILDVNLQLEMAFAVAALVLPIVLMIFTRWANRSAKA